MFDDKIVSSDVENITLKTQLREINAACNVEMSVIQQKSSLQEISIKALLNFSDERLCQELDSLCPILSAAFKDAAGIDIGSVDKFGSKTLCYRTFSSRDIQKSRV